VAIRRYRSESLSLAQLVAWGALSAAAVEQLRSYTLSAKNVLVSGGTGSGKTSLLRCIAQLIPERLRVVSIEDARELHLNLAHVVSLESRPADNKGRGRITIGDLFSASLRLRPDRIVIGELRGEEALDLIQAMTSGHGGCLSTIHASTPLDALRRLETLALYRGLSLPLVALRSQIASGVDVIVQVERAHDGSRHVSEIAEVSALDLQGQYQVRTVMRRVDASLISVGGDDV
jgi:pilus assembly protein CpaF